jgi:hypothetical protein
LVFKDRGAVYDEPREQFENYIKQVLHQIPSHELSSYVVSVRTGVLYFFSKRFRFKNRYAIEDIRDVLSRKIPITDDLFYYPQTNDSYQIDDGLRSSFCNVKPVNQSQKFADELEKHQFYVKEQKYVYRIYLQSEDKQTHVCIIDPASNYSIIEFSKDFQRTSNIGKYIHTMNCIYIDRIFV